MIRAIYRASDVSAPVGNGESRDCRCGEPLQFAARLQTGSIRFYWCRVCDGPPTARGSK